MNKIKFKLDKEEKQYENYADEFVPAHTDMRSQLIQAAKSTQQKTERMNIRMTRQDMKTLKNLAAQEGIPYQTLVTSIIRKYTSGLLVDINEAKKILNA